MKPIVIIPAFNPDEKLISVIEDLYKTELKIVVVDDGSKNQSKHIFEQLKSRYNCDVCIHEINKGKGAALKTGIRHAAYNYPECIGYVTADADGQHSPIDIMKVASALLESPDSLILGTRNFCEKNVPFKSRWGNRITSFVFKMSIGQQCPDTQTGLRGIPKKYTKNCLSVHGDRFEYEMNMLLEFGKMEIPFSFIPISTIYLEKNKSSHFHPMRDSILIYLNILRYSLSSMASAAIDLSLFTLLIKLIFSSTFTGILASTIIARVISGYVNFSVNKHWVFESKNNHNTEMLKYTMLFCSQMLLSWLFVTIFSTMYAHITLIKIAVDSILFLFSYQIQKNFIFQNSRKDNIEHEKVFS